MILSTRRRIGALIAVAAIAAGCGAGPTGSAGATASPVPTTTASCPSDQPAPLGGGETRTVTIGTEKGAIFVKVEGSLSPIAAGNFVALAACGFYDGVVFHRVATLQDGTPFVIQGGDPTGTGTGGPGYQIQDEPVTATYQRGTVAMARSSAPNSVGSQFFIVLDDRDREVLESANTYQIVGSVTGGMDVVDLIYQAADAELPSDPVAMTKVTVANP